MGWDIAKAEADDDDLCTSLVDLSEVTSAWADVITNAISENFASESAGSEPWASLADSTLADRKRKGFAPGPILQRTGDLRDAATSERNIDATSAEVGFPNDHP